VHCPICFFGTLSLAYFTETSGDGSLPTGDEDACGDDGIDAFPRRSFSHRSAYRAAWLCGDGLGHLKVSHESWISCGDVRDATLADFSLFARAWHAGGPLKYRVAARKLMAVARVSSSHGFVDHQLARGRRLLHMGERLLQSRALEVSKILTKRYGVNVQERYLHALWHASQ